MTKPAIALFGAIFIFIYSGPTLAHLGGLAADGCHRDSRTGTRHCHSAPSRSAVPADRPLRLVGDRVYYPNCSAARAAGSAPVRKGAPIHGRHLDRDGDGIGCE